MEDVRKLVRKSRGQKIAVIGAGVTGLAVERVLSAAGFIVVFLDEKDFGSNWSRSSELWDCFKCNSEDLERVLQAKFAFAIMSPGVNPAGRLGSFLKQAGILLLSEFDFSLPYIGMPEVAVTGTNGKTTTVHLINEMLTYSAVESRLVGNVGVPLISYVNPDELISDSKDVSESTPKISLVAEVSSYQLETVVNFKPRVAVLLNVEDDHLERHGSLEKYFQIKSRIFSEQDSGNEWSLVNANEHWAIRLKGMVKERYFPFGVLTENEFLSREENPLTSGKNACFYIQELKQICFLNGAYEERYSTERCKLLGLHNKTNLCAAVAASRLAGANTEAIQRTIDNFKPLEHRVEFVGKKSGVNYINDSKGTNVSAVVTAIDAVSQEFAFYQDRSTNTKGNIHLLLGGMAKEGSWEPVRQKLPGNVKTIIAFGRDGGIVLDRLGVKNLCSDIKYNNFYPEFGSVHLVESLAEAFDLAQKSAQVGDVVLLSPGCASFDAYTDYAARGKHFKSMVAGASLDF